MFSRILESNCYYVEINGICCPGGEIEKIKQIIGGDTKTISRFLAFQNWLIVWKLFYECILEVPKILKIKINKFQGFANQSWWYRKRWNMLCECRDIQTFKFWESQNWFKKINS